MPASKKTARKAAKKTAPARRRRPHPATTGANLPVRVRMYRTGLGDCFLLTFDPGGSEVHVLIDCGSLGATTTGKKLSDAVKDIRATTQDHLHLVIATHEHKDHVCGFRDVNDEFKQIKVDHVWLAWTENPADKLAKDIAKFKGDLATALAAAATALTKNPRDEKSNAMGLAVKSLLDFAGDPQALGAAGLAKTIDEAMTYVRTGMVAKARYLNPGGPAIEENWLPGFRFYVLGPPRSFEKLQDLGEHGSENLYGLAAGLRAAGVLRAGQSGAERTSNEAEMPFDPRFRFAEGDPRIQADIASYLRKADAWRRVDQDWLHSAADLALQLDSLTNNTSLALAIERKSDGKVLLFPADAQEGNWLSWHDTGMEFTLQENGRATKRTAEQLLNATVFYKVGHHGSHNATVNTKGLEMMTSREELVAFIPVDRKVALGRNPQGSWRMPAPALYPELLDKCQGRVVRSDLGWADDAANAQNKAVEKELVGVVAPSKWPGFKRNQKKIEAKAGDPGVTIEALYIDYLLH